MNGHRLWTPIGEGRQSGTGGMQRFLARLCLALILCGVVCLPGFGMRVLTHEELAHAVGRDCGGSGCDCAAICMSCGGSVVSCSSACYGSCPGTGPCQWCPNGGAAGCGGTGYTCATDALGCGADSGNCSCGTFCASEANPCGGTYTPCDCRGDGCICEVCNDSDDEPPAVALVLAQAVPMRAIGARWVALITAGEHRGRALQVAARYPHATAPPTVVA